MTLGEKIKACRQQAGMSQEKVAEVINQEHTSFDFSLLLKKKSFWIVFTVIGAILLFLVWQAGQNVGEDIGKFIYNITH